MRHGGDVEGEPEIQLLQRMKPWNGGVLGTQWETGSDGIVSFCIEHTVTTYLGIDPVHLAGVRLHFCWRIGCAHEEPTKHSGCETAQR